MKKVSLIRRAWTGRNVPLIPEKFTAEVQLDGPKAIPLQELANRHRAEGYNVTEEFFDKKVHVGLGAYESRHFMRVRIERSQMDMTRDV